MNTFTQDQAQFLSDLSLPDDCNYPAIEIMAIDTDGTGLDSIWLDARLSESDLQLSIDKLLDIYQVNNWQISDSLNFNGLRFDTNNLELISEIANNIEENGDSFLAYLEYSTYLNSSSVEQYENCFFTSYTDQDQFIIEYLQDYILFGDLPNLILQHLDLDGIYNRIAWDYVFIEYNDVTYVFYC